MSGPQQYFDEEFRAMMEQIELRDAPRYYKALAWLRPLVTVVVVLGALVACTALGGVFLYVAPVLFLAGVLALARTVPSLRLRADATKLSSKLRRGRDAG